MAEGRFISRRIAISRQLKQVSLEADFLFGRMIPHLDRDGRMDGDPEIVKAIAVPLRSELTPELIRTSLAELDTVGLIEWYEVDGLMVCEFPGFARHQKGMKHDREAASRYPSKEAQGSKSVRRATTSKVDSGSTPDLLRTKSDDVKNEVRVREVKLSEVKGSLSQEKLSTTASSRSAPRSLTEDERQVVTHYLTTHPRRKIDDKLARKFITPALQQFSVGELCLAIDGNAKDPWHQERGKHELGYVLRNADTISGFVAKADPPPRILDAHGDEGAIMRAMGWSQ